MKRMVFAWCFISFTGVLFSQFPQFAFHKMGETDDDLLGQTSLADLDNDGDLDWIVGSANGTIWWFENKGIDSWVMHVLGTGAFTNIGGIAYDVDGDGKIDQVSGQTWYKNPGNPVGKVFQMYNNGTLIAYDNQTGDIDGDGKMDFVSLNESDGLFWYPHPSNPIKKWKGIKISEGVPGGISPKGIADIDEDGDQDIVRSNAWFENEDGKGSKWVPHYVFPIATDPGKFQYSTRVWVADMDKDGDVDVVISEMNKDNCRIVWFEKKDKVGKSWFSHTIDFDTKQDLHSLAVYDFDNDGDLDVFSGGGKMTGDFHKYCFIWENVDGKGLKWQEHQILADYECHEAVAADVDNDGDVDICSKPWKGKVNYCLENLLINNK